MLIDLLKRLGEVFLALGLVFFGLSALWLLDWIIEDDFFLGSEPPSTYYVQAGYGNFILALALLALFAFITWRILTGRARCNWRFIGVIYLAVMLLLPLHNGLPALLRFPGWIALLGKVCCVLVMLYPAVWIFLPRRRHIPQVELPDPHQVEQTAPTTYERS